MQKLWLQLLILAILLAHSSGSPQRLDFILQPLASTHPVDQTARALLGARSHVALGRATVYTLPGACSYSVSATSESPAGLIDVALAPKQRWEACSACQKDLREDEVLCTSVHSCNATVGALDASHDYALVVGRVGLGRGTDETVRVHVTGVHPAVFRVYSACMHACIACQGRQIANSVLAPACRPRYTSPDNDTRIIHEPVYIVARWQFNTAMQSWSNTSTAARGHALK